MAPFATRLEERVVALDVLRGFALFGVLVVNLHMWFRTTPSRYQLALHPWPSALDRAADNTIELLFSLKFMSLFSLLFGAGLAMQRERALAAGESFVPFALRRLGTLACFGVLHVLLLWMGDILLDYALVGLLLLSLVGRRTRTLFILAGALMALPLIATTIELGLSRRLLEAPSQAKLARTLHDIARSVEVYGHGSWSEILPYRLAEYRGLLPLFARASVLVLAAFLLGVLGVRGEYFTRLSERSSQLQALARIGMSAGLAVGVLELLLQREPTLESSVLRQLVGALRPPAALLQAVAYASTLLLLLGQSRWRARLSAVFAAPGRMALSNYLGQSLICSVLFYSWGFGLYDRLSPWQGFATASAIYAAQVFASRWWLARYAQGPAEWLWRRASYRGVRAHTQQLRTTVSR